MPSLAKVSTVAALGLLVSVMGELPTDAGAQCLGFGRRRPRTPGAVVASGFQKAFIYHANGVERIVLQPSYKGIAKDFGVFLAVPEIPKIDKADARLFAELEQLTRPPPRLRRMADVAAKATAESTQSWRGVSVVKRQLVGIYEASVLQASDRRSFTRWLKMNGYTWPKEVEPIFDHYVKAGWFFVAMKVNRNVSRETRFNGPIQPISVLFTQDEILMPMKLTSLTPGGVDFVYYLITDTKIRAKNIPRHHLRFQRPLLKTRFSHGIAPHLRREYLRKDVFLTRQDDLAKTLKGRSRTLPRLFGKLSKRLWLTKYQGHFNRADLGSDFVWESVPPGRTSVEDVLDAPFTGDLRQEVLDAYRRGMRRIKSVRFVAEVYDTNKGYGKPTFINGIQVGDLAAIGAEGSTVWKTISLDLPHSVVHWLRGKIRVKIENYGKKVGKRRYSDAYNIRKVRIIVTYDDGSVWTSKKYNRSLCSVPRWRHCRGKRVRRWGDPVVFTF